MKIVLTDKSLDGCQFPSGTKVVKVACKNLNDYNNNSDVVAIAGSRAMAINANKFQFPGLKLIQLTSAGYDGVPLNDFRRHGIAVANAGSVYSIPIAETVVLGMLLMAKKLHDNPNNRHIKLHRHYVQIIELSHKNVMILGTGSIGTEIAKRLSGFDMIVDGYAQSKGEREYFNTVMCSRKELIDNIPKYDYVISTLPDNDKTRGFLDMELLNQMKDSTVVINVGRKSVLNEEDLYTTLKSEKIGGAVLDMFEKIPNPITNRFRRLNNVIVLPGVAAISQEVDVRLKKLLERNICSLLMGREIECVINGGII